MSSPARATLRWVCQAWGLRTQVDQCAKNAVVDAKNEAFRVLAPPLPYLWLASFPSHRSLGALASAERSTVYDSVDPQGRIWERAVIVNMPFPSTGHQNPGPHTNTDCHVPALRIPESAPMEDMEVSSFNIEHNAWRKYFVRGKLAPHVLHFGTNYGKVLMKLQINDEHSFGSNQYLAKKELKGSPLSSIYEGVKRQAIASGCSKNLCLISPKDFQPRFLEAHACCLLHRQTRQVVRCEEFVPEHTGNKIAVSLQSTSSSDLVTKMSGHQLAALQFCAYKQSLGMMVIASVVQYGTQCLWTEPVIHTMGRTLGGQADLGDEEILKWKKDFTDLYSKLLKIGESELWDLVPRAFTLRLHSMCLFEVVPTPIVWRSSMRHSDLACSDVKRCASEVGEYVDCSMSIPASNCESVNGEFQMPGDVQSRKACTHRFRMNHPRPTGYSFDVGQLQADVAKMSSLDTVSQNVNDIPAQGPFDFRTASCPSLGGVVKL